MYAQVVLQDTYCARTRNQLYGREEDEKDKEEGNSRLPTSTAVLSTRRFRRQVKKMKKKKLKKISEKKTKDDAMGAYRDEKERWERENRARVQRNKDSRAQHKLDVEAWEREKRDAKSEGRPLAWERPATFVVEKAVPKPMCPGRGHKRKAAEMAEPLSASESSSSESLSGSSSGSDESNDESSEDGED